MAKANSAQPCYRRNPNGYAAPGAGCWPSPGYLGRTHVVRLLIETMGGPSWQTVYLCDKHRREAADEGKLKAAAR
jgi:hypothetical protein